MKRSELSGITDNNVEEIDRPKIEVDELEQRRNAEIQLELKHNLKIKTPENERQFSSKFQKESGHIWENQGVNLTNHEPPLASYAYEHK